MGGINRFTKIAPAKFNPLTADEIMKVPLMKEKLEQEQLAAVEQSRVALLNTQSTEGDREKVLAEKKRLNEGFDNLVNDISTNGVSYKSSRDINSFMRDYNTSTSLSGTVGAANAFYNDRKVVREKRRTEARASGQNMATYAEYEKKYDQGQSAFGEEGATNSTYNGFEIPNHLDPRDLYREIAEGAQSRGHIFADGSSYASNAQALKAVEKAVKEKYLNDPAYKSLLDQGIITMEDIDKIIASESEILLNSNSTDAPNAAPETDAARKARLKALEEDNFVDAPIITTSEKRMDKLESDATEENIAVLSNEIDNIQGQLTTEQNAGARAGLQKDLANKIARLNRAQAAYGAFQETNDYKTHSKDLKELTTKENDALAKEYKSFTTTGEVMGSSIVQTSSDKGALEKSVLKFNEDAIKSGSKTIIDNPIRTVLASDGSIIYTTIDLSDAAKNITSKLDKVRKQYLSENSQYYSRKKFKVNSSIFTGSGSEDKKAKRFKKLLESSASNIGSSDVINVTQMVPTSDGDTSTYDIVESDNASLPEMKTTVSNIIESGNYKIVGAEMAMPVAGLHNPEVEYTIQSTSTKGTKETYKVTVSVPKDADRSSAGSQLFDESLGSINSETAGYAAAVRDWKNYGHIIPITNNTAPSYNQSDQIKQLLGKESAIMKQLGTTKFSVMQDPKGSGVSMSYYDKNTSTNKTVDYDTIRKAKGLTNFDDFIKEVSKEGVVASAFRPLLVELAGIPRAEWEAKFEEIMTVQGNNPIAMVNQTELYKLLR